MTDQEKRGGEPGGARLLELARRELLDSLLPQLQGEARYRGRLIANAIRLAAAELQGATPERAETFHHLRELAAAVLPESVDLGDMADHEVATALTAALRAGRLDGRQEFYVLLGRLTEERTAPLG